MYKYNSIYRALSQVKETLAVSHWLPPILEGNLYGLPQLRRNTTHKFAWICIVSSECTQNTFLCPCIHIRIGQILAQCLTHSKSHPARAIVCHANVMRNSCSINTTYFLTCNYCQSLMTWNSRWVQLPAKLTLTAWSFSPFPCRNSPSENWVSAIIRFQFCNKVSLSTELEYYLLYLVYNKYSFTNHFILSLPSRFHN